MPDKAPAYYLLGHRVALEFRPAEGVYVATAIDLPGYYARGATRTEVLRRLGKSFPGQPVRLPQASSPKNRPWFLSRASLSESLSLAPLQHSPPQARDETKQEERDDQRQHCATQ